MKATFNTYESSYEYALEMLKSGNSTKDILTFLAKSAENISGSDTACSILVLDQEGLLRNGASPRLPHDYLQAIDGLKPDPKVGTCAAAAATASMVITEDFYSDSKWPELRHLPLALGYTAAWSTPIIDDKIVLGTFGTYFTANRRPTEQEIKGVQLLAAAAARVLRSVNSVVNN